MLTSKNFFVAINFENNSLFLKKLENFKKRYSTKQYSRQCINLPIIAPFKLKDHRSARVFDEFEEEVNSFFISESERHYLKFTSLGVYQHKKSYLLYLGTRFSTDFEYCIESLNDLKRNYVDSIKKKESKAPYFKLASFQKLDELEEAIESAKREFFLPLEVAIKGVSIYEKSGNNWKFMKRLINFQEVENIHTDLYEPQYLVI